MEPILKFINNLNSGQRAVIIGGFSILFLFLMGLLVYSNLKSQDEKLNFTIATNLTKNQVMMASNELEASNIPFTVIGSGNRLTLKTNQMNINLAKIKLITSEASTHTQTGWEIFDNSSLGTTNFENNIKYLRATEGELSRSLESLSGVLSATVKIAIPKESVFTEKNILPSASAVLTLREGIALTQKQIGGIKNFIASAIPKLEEKNIKLINQNGTLLEQSQEDIDGMKYIQHEKYKSKLESDYENKIIALLKPFIGSQRVIARVSIDLDYTKQDISEEIYNPEGTIRSQQNTETTSNKEGLGENEKKVAPGLNANIEETDNKTTSNIKSKSSTEEARNVTNYEISKKIINQKNSAYAKISKLTTAVTFDESILEKIENKEEFLQNINLVVQEAVGYQEERGDRVTVKAFKFIGLKPFGTEVESETSSNSGMTLGADSTKSVIQEYGEYIQYLIASILLFIFYKKFIANNDINLLEDGQGANKEKDKDEELYDFAADSFDELSENNRLKAKIKTQIANNIDGLDSEEMAKYELLIEEIDDVVSNNPEDISQMIEMLLDSGSTAINPPKKG
ncbi:MAG: flagellar basal-body MS-ring/collar protein FliF [Campylobacterota bacterium]|nr:flagellar basal-body MS-ring/collar protein FliF [Campylobacterota bacterium]